MTEADDLYEAFSRRVERMLNVSYAARLLDRDQQTVKPSDGMPPAPHSSLRSRGSSAT